MAVTISTVVSTPNWKALTGDAMIFMHQTTTKA